MLEELLVVDKIIEKYRPLVVLIILFSLVKPIMKRTAFVKKRNKKNIVPGTHTSVHNGLLLVSTGIPTLDDVLGGGLPVGSVLMVEEDKHTRFSSLLTK